MKETLEIRFCDICGNKILDDGLNNLLFIDDKPNKFTLPINYKHGARDPYGYESGCVTIESMDIEDICDDCKKKIADFIDTIYVRNKKRFKLEVQRED